LRTAVTRAASAADGAFFGGMLKNTETRLSDNDMNTTPGYLAAYLCQSSGREVSRKFGTGRLEKKKSTIRHFSSITVL
jgi:hypothetical protein